MRYIRSRVPAIVELPETRNLIVQYLGENDKKLAAEYDLVVLSVGMQPPKRVGKAGATLWRRLELVQLLPNLGLPAHSDVARGNLSWPGHSPSPRTFRKP